MFAILSAILASVHGALELRVQACGGRRLKALCRSKAGSRHPILSDACSGTGEACHHQVNHIFDFSELQNNMPSIGWRSWDVEETQYESYGITWQSHENQMKIV